MIIVFIGPDGSGKTRIIKEISKKIPVYIASKAVVFHWRPNVLFSKESTGPVTNPHQKSERSYFFSFLKLIILFFDWKIGFGKKIAPLLAKNNLVIFDRYYMDLLVDPKRYRYKFPIKITEKFLKLFPNPDLVFFIKVIPKTAFERKGELNIIELEKQNYKYEKLKDKIKKPFYIIENNSSIEEVVEEIIKIIRCHLGK
jgi:thymidylate kinase